MSAGTTKTKPALMFPRVTLCLTIGNRPIELRRTLESLLSHAHFDAVIAVNDFRDEPTNEVFRELCPEGELVLLPEHVGHHRAADAMYARVRTPYVFHCEDDWAFERAPDLTAAMEMLEDEHVTIVCFRDVEDVLRNRSRLQQPKPWTVAGRDCLRLSHLHRDWHGFTFNPHLAKTALWASLGGFASFSSEQAISRHLRDQGREVAYSAVSACSHIGEGVSVSKSNDTPPFKRMRRWLKSRLGLTR